MMMMMILTVAVALVAFVSPVMITAGGTIIPLSYNVLTDISNVSFNLLLPTQKKSEHKWLYAEPNIYSSTVLFSLDNPSKT